MADYFPSDLADAAALISQPLPTDDLSVIGTLTCGYSRVQKLGNRIATSHENSVPTNICGSTVAHWSLQDSRQTEAD